jgi:hypothetical protein
MKYIDMGYAIVLATLAAYATTIVWRARRLSRGIPRQREAPPGP